MPEAAASQRLELLRGFLQVYAAGARAAALAEAEPEFFDWGEALPSDARARARRAHAPWSQLFEAHLHLLEPTIDLPYEALCRWCSEQVFGEHPEWCLRGYLGGGLSGSVFLAERAGPAEPAFAAVKLIANDPLDEPAPPEHELAMARRFHAAGLGPPVLDARLRGFLPASVSRREHARLFRGPRARKTRRALRSFLGWYAMELADGTLGDLLESLAETPARTAAALAELLRRCAEAGLAHGDAHRFNVGVRGGSFCFLDCGRSVCGADVSGETLALGQAADCAVLLVSLSRAAPFLQEALLTELRASSALRSPSLPPEAADSAERALDGDLPACRRLEKLYLRALEDAFRRPLAAPVDLTYRFESSDDEPMSP